MPLTSSGTISLAGSSVPQSVNLELSRTAINSISLGEIACRTLGNRPVGQISLSDLYGRVAYDGLTDITAAPSAAFIKNTRPSSGSGLYWIKLGSSTAQLVYCDMETDGGGWMLFARTNSTGIAVSWGWHGSGTGVVTDFSAPYQLSWLSAFHSQGGTFNEFLYGNRSNINNNDWGPFIFKYAINYENLMTLDTQQSPLTRSTIAYDVGVYGSTSPPSMQAQVGYCITGTSNNIFYLRDCCGYAGYGIYPNYLSTTYVNHGTLWYYAGPFGAGAEIDANGYYIQSTPSTNYGGTNQVMIMVR